LQPRSGACWKAVESTEVPVALNTKQSRLVQEPKASPPMNRTLGGMIRVRRA